MRSSAGGAGGAWRAGGSGAEGLKALHQLPPRRLATLVTATLLVLVVSAKMFLMEVPHYKEDPRWHGTSGYVSRSR
jgi:hypothetical protein